MQEPKKSSENQQPFAEVYSPEKVSGKSLLKRAVIIVGILLSIAIAMGIVLLATGTMKLSFGAGPNSAVAGSRVCGSDTVTRYNTIIGASVKSEEDRNKVYENLETLNNEIQSEENYTTDPTCLYIGFVVAVNDADAEKATLYATQIDTLANQGTFIDTRLVGIVSTTQLKGTAQSLSTPRDDTQERG